MNFHKSSAWTSKRLKILRRDGYLCQACKRYGRTTGASTVHHIYPVSMRQDLKLMSINLVSLCSMCHNEMHDRISNELTDKGIQWVERIKDNIPPP